ncbi:uncharacterized protein [Mytilus edulis]|uniref:uncharacterized protein n=1 Tax=Mytilus edulis TaxID=6550 RepID=UPI0039EFF116
MKELLEVEQKESSKIEKLLSTLKKKEEKISEVQENLASIKQHATELKTFLTMKDIEKDIIAVEEKFIQTISTSETTNRVNISWQINRSLYLITASLQKFGEVGVSSDPCDVSLQKQKNRQAQIMVALTTRNIDNLNLTFKKRLNTDLSNVQGCSLLPDGRIVFSCYKQDKIRVLKSDGSKDFEISKIGVTFDVVFIGDDDIAVTSGGSETINIIDLKKRKLKTSKKVNSANEGLTYKDGHLIYCVGEKGLQMISLSDESITNVVRTELSNFSYVITFADKLFYTNPNDNSVTCCDYHGNILWTFCDTSVLQCPLGISVDNGGKVFVVGRLSYNVVVISPDGQRCRQLLSRDDGLVDPTVLHYDISTNTLLVTNAASDAFLYEVK